MVLLFAHFAERRVNRNLQLLSSCSPKGVTVRRESAAKAILKQTKFAKAKHGVAKALRKGPQKQVHSTSFCKSIRHGSHEAKKRILVPSSDLVDETNCSQERHNNSHSHRLDSEDAAILHHCTYDLGIDAWPIRRHSEHEFSSLSMGAVAFQWACGPFWRLA